MERFYKITKAEAALIGKFEYAPNQAIDPFVGEQVDGSYLISGTMYNLLKDRAEIKQIDFSKKTPVAQDKLDTKTFKI